MGAYNVAGNAMEQPIELFRARLVLLEEVAPVLECFVCLTVWGRSLFGRGHRHRNAGGSGRGERGI